MNKLRFLLMLQMAANAALALGPFEAAVEKLSAKTPIGSILKTAEWALLPLELRESAFFSATIESGKFLDEAQSRILAAISHARDGSGGLVDRSVFVAELRKIGTELGLRPTDPNLVGTLQDPLSSRRLRLIFDIQTARAAGHAEWKMGNDPDMLDAFPAQELVRKEGREKPRAWHKRWTEAGGKLVNGRMVGLKTDAVWTGISRFGTPWPPFDFQSGMGVIELDRSDAEDLGLLTPEDVLEPAELPFTENMQADVSQMSPRFVAGLKAIFGDQVSIANGKAVWRGQSGTGVSPVMANSRTYSRDTIGRFAADQGGPTGATGDTAKDARVAERLRRKGPLNAAEQITIIDRVVKRTDSGPQIGEDFGSVSKEAVALASPHADLRGYVKRIEPDAVRHIKRRHGDSNTELTRNQMKVTDKDFAMLPVILDKPDRVYPGEVGKDGNPTLWFERGNGPKQRLLVHVRKGRERLAVITFMKERSPAA